MLYFLHIVYRKGVAIIYFPLSGGLLPEVCQVNLMACVFIYLLQLNRSKVNKIPSRQVYEFKVFIRFKIK